MRTAYRLELTGQKFGRWTVSGFSHKSKRGQIYWLCKCECGNSRPVKAVSLASGRSTSCGCYNRDSMITHGMTGTRTFKSWETMKQRCTNPNAPDYDRYGGRGIKVCDRWLNSFDNFLSDMGERPKSRTLDRIDNTGDYTPENCRWATAQEQLRNRRNTKLFNYLDNQYTVKELEDISGIKSKVIRDRIYAGWPVEKAVSTPMRKSRRN